jgi:hypothetical protein
VAAEALHSIIYTPLLFNSIELGAFKIAVCPFSMTILLKGTAEFGFTATFKE